MIWFLESGQYQYMIMLLIALILSLSFHEYGHAIVAKWYGDDTAQKAGRLTLNPISHIDPVGLMMVIFVGFGYAKPVPVNPQNFTSRFADLWVSAAGPFMNLLVALVVWNFYLSTYTLGWYSPGAGQFFTYLTQINLLLMLFNLLPIGPLDGHYILPYFLPRKLSRMYRVYNAKYGTGIFLGLVLLSVLGLPLLTWLSELSAFMLTAITLV